MASNTKPPQDTPNAAQWAKTRVYCLSIGMSQDDINAMIGQTPNGRSNMEISNQARSWVHSR